MLSVHITLLLVTCLPVLYWTWVLISKILYIAKCRSRSFQLPGLPALPILGNIHQIPLPLDGRFNNFVIDLVSKFPYGFHFNVSPIRATVVLTHPKTLKSFLKSTEPKDTLIGGPYRNLLPWLGEGLLISKGSHWFRNRRLLTPAFHFDILKPYMTVYNECAEILLDKWSPLADTKEVKDIYGDVGLFALNVIMRCAFSWKEDVQRVGNSHPYVQAVNQLTNITMSRIFRPWTHFNWLYNLTPEGKRFRRQCDYVHRVANDVISERRKTLDLNGITESRKIRLDFLDILLSAQDENGEGLHNDEIRNEVDTFLFEGHDTTASGMSWLLYSLANNPEIQERAREEIDNLFEGRGDNPRLEWEDLNNIPYLTQCIKEALRLYSPVPSVARRLTKPVVVEGVELLPDTSVFLNFHALHHNPLVWGDDHMTYDPERFTPEKVKHMDSYAFCPFSAGPRNCIGQNFAMNEMKTFAARILHRYQLTTDECPEPISLPDIVTRSKNGIQIKFMSR